MIRRYYSGVQRGDEIINVRDSVLLKSGTRKKDPPFVARVSGLWEEDEGSSVNTTFIIFQSLYSKDKDMLTSIVGYSRYRIVKAQVR